jgi:type IV pilus assembly protein PilA
MLKSNKGFSLVELMIVVAIIGVLAAIAVPNFKRFQMKAKQSEAKSSLSAMYTAQKAFQAEWGMYFGDFADVGYAPEGMLKYRVGFTATAGTLSAQYPIAARRSQAARAANTSTQGFCGANAINANNCGEDRIYTNQALPPAALSVNAFVVGAASDIEPSTTGIDQWTLNQDKILTNVRTEDL